MARLTGKPLRLVIAALVGVGVTVGLVKLAWDHITERETRVFQSEASQVREHVAGNLRAAEALGGAIQGLFHASLNVGKDEFSIFSAATFSRYPFVIFTTFSQKVLPAGKDAYEATVRDSGYFSFQVFELDPSGDRRPVGPRPQYFPILYKVPFSPELAIQIGHDMASKPENVAAIERAIGSGEPVASRQTRPKDGETFYELFVPTYEGKVIPSTTEQRTLTTNGLIALTIVPARLIGSDYLKAHRLSAEIAFDENGGDLFSLVDEVGGTSIRNLSATYSMATQSRQFRLTVTKSLLADFGNLSLLAVALLAGIILTVLSWMTAAYFSDKQAAEARLRRSLEELLEASHKMTSSANAEEVISTAGASIAREMRQLTEPRITYVSQQSDPTLWTSVKEHWGKEPYARDGELFVPMRHKELGQTFLHIVDPNVASLDGGSLRFIATLASSAEIALENVSYLHHLQDMVSQKTSALKAALDTVTDEKRKVKYVLDNVQQGILTASGDALAINPEFSHFAGQFCNDAESGIAGRDLVTVLFAGATASANELNQMREALRAMSGQPMISYMLNEDLLLRKAEVITAAGNRTLDIDWSPIVSDNGLVETILVSFRDVTSEIVLKQELERKDRETERTMRIIGELIKQDKGLTRTFFDSNSTLFRSLHPEITSPSSRSETLNALHSIKGSARTLGFLAIVDMAHEAEDLARDELLVGPKLALLQATFHQYSDVFYKYFDSSGEASGRGSVMDRIVAVFMAAQQSLTRSGVQVGGFQVLDHFGKWSDAGLARVIDVLSHAITNAADHGFILPLTRGTQAPDPACFGVVIQPRDANIHITVTDNGVGFDMAKIKAIALQRGLAVDTNDLQALRNIVLLEGFSTAETVSKTSGRGVGLAAVNAMVTALGGTVDVGVNAPRGARVEVILPIKAIARPDAMIVEIAA